jgi:3-isopropylmalate/(R)-2-methylmalate dehydratase small subunit
MDHTARPLNPDFPLNFECYHGASILLTRENFGCGSSREHAAWAMEDFGFRCVIAPSFADIFCSNALKNGILPIALAADQVEALFTLLYANEGLRLTVDLESCSIQLPDGALWSFSVDAFRRDCLLQGLDDIGLTLQSAEAIRQFEQQHEARFPWLFRDITL